jgi:hypothetical protein
MLNAVRWCVCALLFAGACVGCNTSTCDRAADTVSFSDGIVRGNSYESSPWDSGYQYFPPARTIRFFHGLNTEPSGVEVNLAFDDHGFGLAPTAGNSGIFEKVDACEIDLKNDTCSEFYVRLTAERPVYDGADSSAAGASGADDAVVCPSADAGP